MDAITTHSLTKTYGAATVVHGLDLRVPAGCVYGFLGPNGSGKSTTMKMLLSLVRPSGGEITVLGRPMRRSTRRELLRSIGSLIEAPSVYTHLTGMENLRVVQRLRGLSDEQLERALGLVRLGEQRDKLVKNYSLGMKQRLGIAMALAGEPRLLVLDEPTNGLDPAGTEEIRDLLVSLAGQGVTVMVSSHLLAEMERMADVLGIIHQGRMVFQGTRAELFDRALPDLLVDTPDVELARTALGDLPVEVLPTGLRVPGMTADATASIVAQLVAHRVAVHGVRREQQRLEDVFMSLTGRGGAL